MGLSTLVTIIISMVTFVWRYPPRVVWMPQMVNIQAPPLPLLVAPVLSPANTTIPNEPTTDLDVWSRVDPPASATPPILFCLGLVCLVLFLRLRLVTQSMEESKPVPPPAGDLVRPSRGTQTLPPVTPALAPAPLLCFSTVMHTQFRAVAPSYLSADEVRAQVASHQFRVLDLEIDLGRKQTELNEALYMISRLEKQLRKQNIEYDEDAYFSGSDEAEDEAEMLRSRIMARQAREKTVCRACRHPLKSLRSGLCHVCNARKPVEPTFASAFKELETRRKEIFQLRRENLLAAPSPSPPPTPAAPKVAVATPMSRKLPGSFEQTPVSEQK